MLSNDLQSLIKNLIFPGQSSKGSFSPTLKKGKFGSNFIFSFLYKKLYMNANFHEKTPKIGFFMIF